MNGIALYDALTKIDDRLLDRAERDLAPVEKAVKKRTSPRWAIVAECACLLLIVSAFLFHRIGTFPLGGKKKGSSPGGRQNAAATEARAPSDTKLSTPTEAGITTGATHERNTHFTLSKVDGQFYLNFDEGNDPTDAIPPVVSPYPSLDALIAAIRANDLSDRECEFIRTYFPKNGNGILIFDPDQVFDAVLPNEMTVGGVVWEGPAYTFEFDDGQSVSGNLRILTPKDYAKVFASEYEHFFDRQESVLSRENVADRDAEVVFYRTVTGNTFQAVLYTLPNGVFVFENYSAPEGSPEAVPVWVALFGDCGDAAFQAMLFELTERPSVEWLSQFGLAAR